MRRDSAHNQVTAAVNDGWVAGGSFLGSILSGTLLGSFADRWLGTDPWLVVLGILLGTYSGFLRVWQYSKKMLEPRPGATTVKGGDLP
jgi:ATP synthase protein I